MVLCQLTYTTNRQINISTCPHRVVILNIAPKVFRTAKRFCMVVQCSRMMLDKLLSAGWYVMTNGTLLFAFFSLYIGSQKFERHLGESWHLPSICLQWSVSKMWFETMYDVQKHPMHTTIKQHTYRRRIQKPRRVVPWRFCTVLGVFVWLSSAHEQCWLNYWAQDGMWWQMALCCSR
jgi:hypothetical protein